MNRVSKVCTAWSLRILAFLILGGPRGHTSPAHAWQDYPRETPFLREATPPVLYGGIPTLLTPEDLKRTSVTVDAPLLLSQNDSNAISKSPLQYPPPLQPPIIPEDLQDLADETVRGTSTDTQFVEGPLDTDRYFVYRPAMPVYGRDGNIYLRPNLRIEEKTALETSVFSSLAMRSDEGIDFIDVDQHPPQSFVWEPTSLLSNAGTSAEGYSFMRDLDNPVKTRSSRRGLGVGHERLPFALSHIPASQPFNHIRVRSDFQYGWEFPNRAEYLWAAPPKGPKVKNDELLDLQEYGILIETGTETFSVATELPLIWLNPSSASSPNTSGFGDMSIATKLVLLKGQSLQFTQITRTHLPTGQASSGRGNGHVSMEPGIIARYSKNDRTMFHGMVTFLFPIGGNPNFSGEVLEYSCGVAKVWYDSDQFAVIPTLEIVNWAVLSGAKGETPDKISGDYISNLQPGVRFVFDRGGDLGLFEAGVGSGFSLTNNHFYETLIRFDLRWSY